MNIVEKLFEKKKENPITNFRDVELHLGLLYEKIQEAIPGSALLVSGSAAFYKHYHKHIGGEITIGDLDISLVHNVILTNEIFEEVKSHPDVFLLRENCAVIQMGHGEFHIDTRQHRMLQHFRSGMRSSHRLIRFDNRANTNMLYQRLNRPKDQYKLQVMAQFPRDH